MNAIHEARAMKGQAQPLHNAGDHDAEVAVLNEALKILYQAYDDANGNPAEQQLIAAEQTKVVAMLRKG